MAFFKEPFTIAASTSCKVVGRHPGPGFVINLPLTSGPTVVRKLTGNYKNVVHNILYYFQMSDPRCSVQRSGRMPTPRNSEAPENNWSGSTAPKVSP
jgi:hypothetical protein